MILSLPVQYGGVFLGRCTNNRSGEMDGYFYTVVFQKKEEKRLKGLLTWLALFRAAFVSAAIWFVVEMLLDFGRNGRALWALAVFVALSFAALWIEIRLDVLIKKLNGFFRNSEEPALAAFHRDMGETLTRTGIIKKSRYAILFATLGVITILLVLLLSGVFPDYVVYYIKILTCAFSALYVFSLLVFTTRVKSLENGFLKRNEGRVVRLSCLKGYTKGNDDFKVKKPSRFLSFVGTLFFGRAYAKRTLKMRVFDNASKIKPPYILLVNHQSGFDFLALHQAMYPRLVNGVIAYNQMLGHKNLWLKMGMIPKRQFDLIIGFLRQAKKVAENKGIIALYPEGKITCDGRRGEMSPAVAKLLKLLALPVVVCCIKGCYLFRPKWAYKKRKSGGVEVHINPLFSTEEIKTLSVEEIFDKVLKAFEHDEFEWQKQNGIRITEPFRAEGLDRILYKCPHCKEEFETGSLGDTVFCSACGKQWKLSETGRLAAADGETEYESIPDWYDFQRKSAREAVEDGYLNSERCTAYALPDLKGWKLLGEGSLMFDGDTLTYSSDDGDHIEFDARPLYTVPYGFSDGLLLAKDNVTYSFVFEDMRQATKLNLLIEESYKKRNENRQ